MKHPVYGRSTKRHLSPGTTPSPVVRARGNGAWEEDRGAWEEGKRAWEEGIGAGGG